jgi:hypothetical protein
MFRKSAVAYFLARQQYPRALGWFMVTLWKVYNSDWYHTAKNDTEAMWDIMMALLGVGLRAR